ncbi:MAG: PilN domain-containing protein [Candidatus Melainabacteria bacterium]|nr:PilN domain-containing protein [Candidatus Melainabacteria bacterium]
MAGKTKTGKKFKKILALEICESGIVATEVQFVKNSVVLLNSFRLDIPVFDDLNKTIQYLKQTIRASHITTKDCIVGLSMQYFKLFPVPIPVTIPEAEIGLIVAQEGNVDEASDICAWTSLSSTSRQDDDGVNRIDVLGISMKYNALQSILEIVKKAGLKPHIVTPAFIGLRYFLVHQPGAGLKATLWVSQIKSELVVWSGLDPIYEHLFLTLQLNDQVFQSINLIQSQLSGAQISQIYACGPFVMDVNLSSLPNITSLGIPDDVIDKGKVFKRNSPIELLSAIGLAVQGSDIEAGLLPNLLDSPKASVSTLGGIFKGFTPSKAFSFNIPIKFKGKTLDPLLSKYALISILVFLLSFASGLGIKTLLLPSVIGDKSIFEGRVKTFEKRLTEVSANQNVNKVLDLKINYLSDLIERRMPWSQIFREIADMTPKTLWIDRLEIRHKRIDVFGRALNVDSVANFSINLNYTAKLVKGAQIIALRKFQEDDIDFIEFQVSVNANGENDEQPENATAEAKDKKLKSKIAL